MYSTWISELISIFTTRATQKNHIMNINLITHFGRLIWSLSCPSTEIMKKKNIIIFKILSLIYYVRSLYIRVRRNHIGVSLKWKLQEVSSFCKIAFFHRVLLCIILYVDHFLLKKIYNIFDVNDCMLWKLRIQIYDLWKSKYQELI